MGISRFSKQQIEIFKAVVQALVEHKPLVIASGHGQGKDWIASIISLWFLYSFVPSKVIVTAPTGRQVEEVMWGEIEDKWNNAAVPLEGRLLSDKVDIGPNHYLIGFTTKETGNMVGKFQGFHSPNICVINSEAQAIPDAIYEQQDGILTSENSLQVLIGNPLHSTGKFARAIKNTTANIVLHLSVLDSPNYRYQEERIPGMASYHWVEAKRKEWGEDHPLWYARVLGELPPTSINTVFPIDLLDRMTGIEPKVLDRRLVVSCDPARFGDDETVIYGGISGKVVKTDILQKSAADAVVSHELQMVKYVGGDVLDNVQVENEADGLGGPICDFFRKLKGETVHQDDVTLSSKPDNEDRFANMRAEVWFDALAEVEAGRISIPDDKYLKEELAEVKYFFNMRGKIQLESKDDIKERLGRSPNRADAFVLLVRGFKKAQPARGKKDRWNPEDTSSRSGVSTNVKGAMTA